MSNTQEEIPKEEKWSTRSSDEDRKKKKKSPDATDGISSSRSAASAGEIVKKKKKKSDKEDASVHSSHTSREKKKKKKLMEASEEERRSILDRLESKGSVAASSGATETEGSFQEDASSRERKHKKKSKHGEELSHRSSKSKKTSSKDDSSARSKKQKEHRHSSRSKGSSAPGIDDDMKPNARIVHDDEDVKIAAAPTKRRSTASSDRMFKVTKGDGGKQWGDGSEHQSLEDTSQFSSSSLASGFSMPVSSRAAASSSDSSKAGAVQVGAIHSTDVPDRIQNMLDRKFLEYDGTRGEEGQGDESAAAASQVGAHRETNVPARIQNMLDQKFTEYGQSSQPEMAASSLGEKYPTMSRAEKEMQQFQPTYVTDTKSNIRSKLHGSFNDDPNLDSAAHRNLAPAGSVRFTMFNTGQDKLSVATPTPDVLAERMMDGHDEIGLNSVEKTEARLAAGLCPDCGRTRTHEKIKYGPFQAFRRLEPVTTPGHVYKGYCLFCNNLHDLRRYLHEPYLREQDLDGSLAAPLASSKGDDHMSASGGDSGGVLSVEEQEQDFARRKRRIQICLFTAVIAVIAGGIGLAVTFAGNSNVGTPTAAAAAPPTPAPGPLGWYQMGPDISQPIESFGYKVSLSNKGNRIAVASPKANTNFGRVDVFEFVVEGNWQSVGQPVLGDFEGDMAGFAMDLSGDGKHLVIGYPGNEAGYVRVYRLTNGEWKQLGSTIKGETSGGWFGASVAIVPDGTSIVVGAPYDTNENGSEAGLVRVFILNETSDWEQVGSDLFGRAALDHFGKSVDLSADGTKLAVGAPNNDDRWQDGGQVHIYEVVTTSEGLQDWKESLKRLKILGDEEGHEFGSSMALSGFGDIVVSSSLIASNDAGTVGGGDPRAVYISYNDDYGEELGYGFPEIPGTLGLGYGCDIDYEGTKVILSTLNLESAGISGKAMMYDITGKANWYIYSDEYGGEKLGPEKWLGDGPSVTLSESGDFFGIGYESIVVDAKTKESAPVVRVYGYGHGPPVEGEEEEPKTR